MRLLNFSKNQIRRLACLSIACLSFGGPALAATTFSATEVTKLTFGVLQKPTSGTQTFTIDSQGPTSGTGTVLYGTPTPGQYTLTCTGTCTGTVTLDVQNINSGNANVTISNFQGIL